MFGISYGAISQLFTAQTDPPDLAAIAPLSTIDATQTTLYPGGILNTGFAVAWAEERQAQAQPAGLGLKGTQPYAEQQIAAGDATCKANQVLHGEANNLLAKIRANAHYVPKVADPLDPITFVNRIHVPVFLACQFEDEQTGGHCPALVPHFTGTTQKWFTFVNGYHIDSLDPSTFDRLYDFLSLFVARRSPLQQGYTAVLQAAAPVIYNQAMGTNGDTLPVDPIQAQPTYADALAAFRRTPEVTVDFDNGAGADPQNTQAPGDPYSSLSAGFSTFPVPGTVAQRWFLAPGGALTGAPPAHRQVDWFHWTPSAMPLNDWTSPNTSGGGLWGDVADWGPYQWKPNPAGTDLSYVTAPLTRNTVVVGAGAVHLWARSASRDVDLQVTISEVRPDGEETFVQDGWLQANERALNRAQSTLLDPVLSLRAADVRAMPRGRFVEFVIPLYYEGHAYRAGSRIRVTIAAPNGTQPVWSFGELAPRRPTRVWVELSRRTPSSLILPVVPGVTVPAGLPPCPSLRSEPCRAYQAPANLVAR
jgi:predicted acyl esterase